MKFFKKILAGFIGTAMLSTSGIFFNAFASAEQILVGYCGDINMDNNIDLSDAASLQKYLMNPLPFENSEIYKRADLNEDGKINISDLSLLKQIILGKYNWRGIYEEREIEPTFIDAPISSVSASMPSQGDAGLVIFYIDFPDCKYSNKLTTQQIEEMAFGQANNESEYYPFESMNGFFERSSKESLNLSGNVFSYTAKNPISSYNNNKVALTKECFEAFKNIVDFSQYDKDKDGIIDATLLTVPETASDDYWWPCAGGFEDSKYKVDGVKVGHLITGNSAPSNYSNFNSTYLHEMGHCMGLPDYYLYFSADSEGMHGAGGIELMDMDAYSDFCSFSKLMLGWYQENQVSVYDTSMGTQTYKLKNAQTKDGNCVIIPCGKLDNNYFSEYFIVEYATTDNNNSAVNKKIWWESTDSGIRIHHINAELYSDKWTYLKYQNGSEHTKNDDAGIRLIRLVNDGGSMFKTGSIIDNSTPGFKWYDNNEQESIPPNISIEVGELQNNEYTITISPSNLSVS